MLLDRAEEVRRSLGYTDVPVDQYSSLAHDRAYLEWGEHHGSGEAHWRELADGRPAAVLFWYRTSPVAIIPKNPLNVNDLEDPPLTIAGSTLLAIDTKGRLTSFAAVPPQVDSSPPWTGTTDWRPLFAAASLDPATFTETTPARTPLAFSDERRAWKGTLPETKTPVTIEAAAYRGRPVSFELVAPWTSASRQPDANRDSRDSVQTGVVLVLLVAAVVLARRNLRSGRADRRGAFRLGVMMFAIFISTWVLLPHLTRLTDETDRLFTYIGIGLFIAGVNVPGLSRDRTVRPAKLADDAGGMVAGACRAAPRCRGRARPDCRHGERRGAHSAHTDQCPRAWPHGLARTGADDVQCRRVRAQPLLWY